MPIPLLIPIFTGITGFIGGMFTGNGLSNLFKGALVVGGGYLIFTQTRGK